MVDSEALRVALGRVVRRIREDVGLSQTALAPLIHRSRSWISALENGGGNPQVRDLVAIARVLGQSPASVIKEALRFDSKERPSRRMARKL
ncbi:MAG TPA: helix-turn-helix transcriptional regulator [Polyangiaceae bacterium]|nr:helix-turn-helix transcriptional regulator [Polyangiaceae bacterium]